MSLHVGQQVMATYDGTRQMVRITSINANGSLNVKLINKMAGRSKVRIKASDVEESK